jgi:hypothetical protein
MGSEGNVDEDEELHNSCSKLCNSDTIQDEKSAEGLMTDRWYDEDGNMHIYMPLSEVVPDDGEVDEEDPYLVEADARAREAPRQQRDIENFKPSSALSFTHSELDQYVTHRSEGLADKSQDWIKRASQALWESTQGEISQQTVTQLRTFTLEKYSSPESHSKVLSFAKAFLKFLATTKAEPNYLTFAPYLELPKTVKERKSVTARIVTKQDIRNVLEYIKRAERERQISPERSAQYSAFVLFGAYTGQRSEATIAKLTVGQFGEALAAEKPVIQVDSSQDKIRMSHYIPLHPRVVEALEPLLAGRNDGELMFSHGSFLMWIKRQKIPMSRFQKHFVLSDLRKFAEQYGDVIEWDQSNREYILTHGVSGVEWSHYRNPLPENVYDIYMKYWKDVDLTI